MSLAREIALVLLVKAVALAAIGWVLFATPPPAGPDLAATRMLGRAP